METKEEEKQSETQSSPIHQQHPTSLIAYALVILGIGFGAGYLVGKTPTPDTKDLAIQPTPSIQVTKHVSPIESGSTLVTTAPLHANRFEKRISKPYEYCSTLQEGVVSYRLNNDLMRLNSLLYTGDESIEKGLADIDKLLETNTLVLDQELNRPLSSFMDDCGGGYYTKYLKELPGIVYPGTDKVRVFMAYMGQDYFGLVGPVILAKKGNDLIYIDDAFDDPSYNGYRDQCGADDDVLAEPAIKRKKELCYAKLLVQDKNLEQKTINKAKELITIFALQ